MKPNSNLQLLKQKLRPLSEEEQLARRPLPPDVLVDALQDPLPRKVTKTRGVKAVRSSKKPQVLYISNVLGHLPYHQQEMFKLTAFKDKVVQHPDLQG